MSCLSEFITNYKVTSIFANRQHKKCNMAVRKAVNQKKNAIFATLIIMNMNFKKFLGLPVAAGLLVTAMLAGCSGEKKSVSASEAAGEMYSHISADATVLVRVDFKSVMENAGADFSGDKFKPGKVLQEVLDKVTDEVPEFN